MKQSNIAKMKCQCGAIYGVWFSERLGRYICPPCLDKKIIELKKTVRKALVKIQNEGSAHANALATKLGRKIGIDFNET